jgi:exonuclease III
MNEHILIYSQNCQGISNTQKRRDLFHYLRQKKYDIICLQDIHITKQLCSYVKAEWGNDIFICPFLNNSRGVLILFRDTFEYKVANIYIDEISGNYVILDTIICGKKLTLASIYGPNDDNPTFFENIFNKIKNIDNEYAIICGDWNLVLNPHLDYENYLHVNNSRARSIVLNYINIDDYVDIWRVMHEDKRQYTWQRLNPVKKQSRLDFFLINNLTQNCVIESSIVTSYRSDHKGILLNIKLTEVQRGPGYWKFNNSLLKDENYVKIFKNTLVQLVNQHRDVQNDENDTNLNDNVTLNINDQLFLETFLVVLRGETIKYSSTKKKQTQKAETELEKNIEFLEKHIEENYQNIDNDLITEL